MEVNKVSSTPERFYLEKGMCLNTECCFSYFIDYDILIVFVLFLYPYYFILELF